jgi:hypothetical protein
MDLHEDILVIPSGTRSQSANDKHSKVASCICPDAEHH